jgi:hypothetical protein
MKQDAMTIWMAKATLNPEKNNQPARVFVLRSLSLSISTLTEPKPFQGEGKGEG